MKFPKQFKFYKLFVVSALVIGVGGSCSISFLRGRFPIPLK